MKLRFVPLLLLLGLSCPQGMVWAQARWRDLPSADRQQMRQQMRDHWQNEGAYRQTQDVAPRWRDLPPEDRRRMREEIREQRGWQDPRNDRMERGGRGWRND